MPLAAGAALRLVHLDRQILLQDEMHAVRTALRVPIGEILSEFRAEDPCLPLSAFYRWLMDRGVRFSELTFRLPVLAASLVGILALPVLAKALVGRRAAILFAWLLALSPVLALYGGMVRPYGIVALLAPAALCCVLRWRDSGRLGWGLGYAVLAALGLYVHLETAPLIGASFALLLIEKATRRLVRPSLANIAVVTTVLLAAVATFLLPAWRSLETFVAAKSASSELSWRLLPPVLHLQAGSASTWVAALFWALAAFGLFSLLRSRTGPAVYIVVAIVAQWAGLLLDRPFGLDDPAILNRYLIGTLPFVLLLVAIGLDSLPLISSNVAGRRRRWLWTAVAASFLLAIAATGPFADRQFLRSSFQHGQDLMRFDRPAGRIDLGLVPSFYRSDALAAPGASIVEFPFRGGWSATRAHAVYQGTHHARVLAAEPYRWLCNSRLRLRNHVCYRPDSILASDARFLVIHRDPLREEHRIVGGDDSGNAYDPAEWNRVRRISRHLTRQLRREWGAPFDEDDRIVVWDLAAVRSERRTRIGGG